MSDVDEPTGRTADPGDFVRVASFATPTEAHLISNVLQSAGLAPQVADANIVQANTWMTHAVGGVRVLVPASQAEEARRTIAEFNAGAFRLEGEEAAAPVVYSEQPAPVFSPDQAALFSLALTPVFGAAIQMINAATLQWSKGSVLRWLWLIALTAISVLVVIATYQDNRGPTVIFEASLLLWFVTAIWYFAAGKEQSRLLISTYGPQFRKKRLLLPGLACAGAWLVLGWALSEWA